MLLTLTGKEFIPMENSVSFVLPTSQQKSVSVVTFGHSVTESCHKYGPAVRSYYLLHYILEGKGVFSVDHTDYHLKAGQGFLIEPDYLTTYTADETEPWTYIWIGFDGTDAPELLSSIGLSQAQPVFESTEKELLHRCVTNMLAHNHSNTADTFAVLGDFYQFLSVIAASTQEIFPKSDGNLYVRQAAAYIHNHFAEPLTVEEIARHVGLNRSYFSGIFKEQTGQSPLEYIQNFRLTKAEHLLTSSTLPVAAIAYSCGYQRPESLIKIFRHRYGVSPAVYRRSRHN